MPNASNDTLLFTKCSNLNTDTCPHMTSSHMQLSIINQPNFWLLDDKTVEDLNSLCDDLEQFMKK